MGSATHPAWWVTLAEIVFIGIPFLYIIGGSVCGWFDQSGEGYQARKQRRDNMHSAAYHAKHHHGGHH